MSKFAVLSAEMRVLLFLAVASILAVAEGIQKRRLHLFILHLLLVVSVGLLKIGFVLVMEIYTQTYLHTSIYTSIHISIHPSIHTYIHTHMHIYIHTYIHTYIHIYINTYIHTFIQTFVPHM